MHGSTPSRQETKVLGWTRRLIRTLAEDLSSRERQRTKAYIAPYIPHKDPSHSEIDVFDGDGWL
jgi:hypothetical protein